MLPDQHEMEGHPVDLTYLQWGRIDEPSIRKVAERHLNSTWHVNRKSF
jgi:hypothetical protein